MSGVQPRFPPFPVQLPVSEFRYCISCWANQFKVNTDPDDLFATFLYAIGHHINMDHGSWEMSWWKIADEMVAMRRKFRQDLKRPSRSTINRMMKRAREYGILETERTSWRNPENGKVLPGDNRIFLNVNKIVVYGQEREYDFLTPVREQGETPENAEPALEGAQQVSEAVSVGSPAALGEPSRRHRGGIDDASDEASMTHTTRNWIRVIHLQRQVQRPV